MKKFLTLLRPVPLLLFVSLLLLELLPLRMLHMIFLVEPETGFWSRINASVYVFFALVGVVILLPVVFSMIGKRSASLDFGRRERAAEGMAAWFFAAALVFDALAAFFYFNLILTGYARDELVVATESNSPMQYYLKSGAVAALMEGLFGAAGAVFFVTLGIQDLFRKARMPLNRLLMLMPLFWTVCRLLRRFTRTISYVRVSDLFLDLLMLAALMIFFLAFAQVLGGIGGFRKEARLLGAGIPAAVLALVCFVPRFVLLLIGKGGALSQDAPVEPCDLAAALFILTFLYGRLRFAVATEMPDAAPGSAPVQGLAGEKTAPAADETP
ncbi:MAG: hypothetical protein LBJ11_08660 [Oscillospiraceae bacterium]|jgi:hypothetical protein|nr:hypothetical protein [Oscillospiraceae bacterium]